ncbi:hypothetical protein D3C87_2132280 [compost metagenome]
MALRLPDLQEPGLSDVLPIDRLLAPEQRVFVGFFEGAHQHVIIAFFPDFFRQFFVILRDFKNRFGNFWRRIA